MLTTLPDCLFHKIAHHANQHAVLVRLSQSNREMRSRMRLMLPELSALRLTIINQLPGPGGSRQDQGPRRPRLARAAQ